MPMLAMDNHYFQAILESQKNIVFVLDSGRIQSVNKAFLRFFDVRSVEDFYNKHENFCKLFLKDDDFQVCMSEEESWQKCLLANPSATHKVTLARDEKEYIFKVGAAKIEESTQIVISFTDITELENERKMYQLAASTDTLTGIANRLKFNTILEQQIALTRRYDESFSLVLMDIDHFKKVNDTYGHKVGDDVLIVLANTVKSFIRDSDTFARWGGEEFALIFPQTQLDEAYALVEKIRQKIAEITFGEGFHITCSFGLCMYTNALDSDSFLKEVDILLYRAKRGGRNRVCTDSC